MTTNELREEFKKQNKCSNCGVEINYEGICEVCYWKDKVGYEQYKNQNK